MHYLSNIDYGVIGAYLIILLGIGFALRKIASQSMESYFLAGNRLPWWMLGVSGMGYSLDIAGTMLIISLLYMLGPRGLFIEFRGGSFTRFALPDDLDWQMASQVGLHDGCRMDDVSFWSFPRGRFCPYSNSHLFYCFCREHVGLHGKRCRLVSLFVLPLFAFLLRSDFIGNRHTLHRDVRPLRCSRFGLVSVWADRSGSLICGCVGDHASGGFL